MTVRWLLATLHLLALGIGLGSAYARGAALSRIQQENAVRRALAANSFWGLSALIWIPTGLIRAFGGFEKGSSYYLSNSLFWVKMTLLTVILLLEILPIIRLTTWRLQLRDGSEIDTSAAAVLSRLSYAQVAVVVLMVAVATAMARGVGFRP
jgi:putative membrane protein